MDEYTTARTTIEQHLLQVAQDHPLDALTLGVSLQERVDALLLDAVRSAVKSHSWTEIGRALGTSKQAAHQKYVKSLANSLVEQRKTEKTARRAGDSTRAAYAKASQTAAATELRSLPRP